MKLSLIAAAVVLPAGLALAAADMKAADPHRVTPIRVLVITGGHGFDHSEFFQMFDGQPDIAWTETRQPEAAGFFAPEKAAGFDVFLWYDFGQAAPAGQAAAQLEALLAAGKPMLILHHAISSYKDWPVWEKAVGAKYLFAPEGGKPVSTYKHDQRIAVNVADPKHPITRFMSDFDLVDETYDAVPMQPGVTPLLTTQAAGSMKILGWTHTYAKSPIVYLQSGHGPNTFRHPAYRRLIAQSIRFLAGQLQQPGEEGFTSLFNGKDLAAWTVVGKPEGFKIKDGVLFSEAHSGGEWLRSNKTYRDFILRVEWKVGPGGNAGVFVRSAKEGYPWVTGSEIQITNEYRDLPHCTGSLYGDVAVAPRPDERADVWHEFEIQCVGRYYKVFCDGVPVVDADARLSPRLAARPLEGYIGLQDSHNREATIEYRNIRIKELPVSKGAAVWRLGTQAYSFHKFTLAEAIDKAQALGLTTMELFPGQALSPEQKDVKFDHHSPAEIRAQVKERLKAAGLTAMNYGVVSLPAEEKEARSVFEFAKDMGLETIVSEPPAEAFDLLDKLTQEYGINVAIHNHPRPSMYWDPKVVLKAVEGRNPRIGACADTGHWVRSGVNPMAGLKMLEGRIISLHFKDLNEVSPGAHDVPWGTGISDARGLLAELHRQGFSGVFSIEYEYNWMNSMPEIAQCVSFFNKTSAELARSGAKK